ncbi:MAG: ABC transporter substrate-binding protein [Rhodoplanes sp.]|uniref:ABC transporter substrate-binding protein n=1 Tax=Rhodoplanes sp. TaxID=1968906 RepID=UPI0017B5D58B|nr:ABC transporter substrate-binding protein [Rhodoplanes sp.]NVO14673.1 ABC transporter substrate-binding protein [Rhodoplanes sp.]
MTIRGLLRCLCPLLALAAALSTGVPAAAQPFLKFSLDGRIDGEATPYLLALDRGYLKAEGLDVSIDPAAGPHETLTRVASGTYDLGVVDINALIRYRDQNPGVAMPAVFMVYNRPAFAVLARRSRGINGPRDLDGKRVGASAADGSLAYFRIFARLNDIDAARLRLETVALPVREPMLAAGQVDAISATTFTAIDLTARGVPADDIAVLPMADYGVELYGQAIIASPRLAAERGDTVRAFLRAFVEALKDTVRDPGRAVEVVVKRIDGQPRARELERLEMALKGNILTSEVRANGFGTIEPARFARAIDQLAFSYEFRAKSKAVDVFEPSYLPPKADRMPP